MGGEFYKPCYMEEFYIYGKNLVSAYHHALHTLYEFGETAPCPDYNTT